MGHLLHLGALVPSVIGICCLAADRRRARVAEVAASVLMLVAMADAALLHVMPVAAWAGILVVGAMGMAGIERVRRGRTLRARPMTVHTALGMIGMGALLMVMAVPAHAVASVSPHAHGGAPLTLVCAGAAVAFAIGSVVAGRRPCSAGDRAQYASMGASALIMAAAVIA